VERRAAIRLCSNGKVTRRLLDVPGPLPPLSVLDEGEGPPVVLLHGQPGAARTWRHVSKPLSAQARVIAPDRPGYGETGGKALSIAGNARAVTALLDRLELDRAILVGHSWGGGVAISVAQAHPERVAGLVLVCSIGTCSSVDAVDRVLARPGIGPALTYGAFRALPRLVPLPVARRFAPGLGNLSEEAVRDLIETLEERRDWRSFLIEQRALVREIGGLDARLNEIAAPTRVLIGAKDFLVPPSVGRELAARIGGAETRVIPGAGHVLPAEAPQAICEATLELTGLR
jgi:pimeloyl-ACP methyl ester carboxylesterase